MDKKQTKDIKAIKKAVKIAGSQKALGEKIGAQQGQIADWCRGRFRIPAHRAFEIAAVSDHKVTPEDLAPWFFKHIKGLERKHQRDTRMS